MIDIFNTQNKYNVIYADPPWSYYNDMTVGPDCTTVKGMRRPPYPVMSVKDICELPVKDITAEDAILFIWTTDYHLGRCINEVIPAWGFEYKTIGFVWAKKDGSGKQVSFMGAYTKKSGCELCLIATKGNPHKMVVDHKVNSFIESPRQEHSKKPDIVRESIVRLVGQDRKMIELFAREKYNGWDCWGNDINIL
jgi:site-specific DNA-methyltransferase (adenine-specific)